MASTFVATGEESSPYPLSPSPSPRELRRSWSTNSSACTSAGAGAAPKCVCAPATHAGSFKCRLHRMNSQGHHSPPASPTMSQPPPANPMSSNSPSRTVEAQ